ncbi:MAG: hypothetical protein ACE5JU_21665 [Candidatus Binatia bacterium]
MKTRTGIFLATLSLLILSSQNLRGEPMRATENLKEETVLLPQSVPEREPLIPVTSIIIDFNSEFIAILAFYDDIATKRDIDYVELYSLEGDLLVIQWVDEFGIPRTAADRGLLRESKPKVEGVLVLISEGTPL